MLDIEAMEVRRFEGGEAPAWVRYALIGLEYRLSGAVSDRSKAIGKRVTSSAPLEG